MQGNAVIGQSGGPTAVINSSLVGVIEKAQGYARKVFGMQFGIEGFMQGKLFDLSAQKPSTLKALLRTPSSALGSSRHKLQQEDLPKIVEILKKHDIRWFFLIGGNDTMDTIHRVCSFCKQQNYELIGVGIPKTVDNDLFGTDHTPGFASAARSSVLNVLQGGILGYDMRKVDRFIIYQTIGRDAGWLASSTALARKRESDPPHLIYVPEHPFSKDKFLSAAEACASRYGWVSIVCGEGIRYADGQNVSASTVKDSFNNIEYGSAGGGSAAIQLHAMLREAFNWRGEFQVVESLVMSDFVRASALDLHEARLCGREAVRLAKKGQSGVMVSMHRMDCKDYAIQYSSTELSEVAIKARPLPENYYDTAANWPTASCIDYCKPLISPLPSFGRLEEIWG